MNILAIDPGTTQSAFVLCKSPNEMEQFAILPNSDLLDMLSGMYIDVAAIEFMQSYSMPVGREVFETCLWSGRFFQVLSQNGIVPKLVARQRIKTFVTGIGRANDANVRQALINKYGGSKKGEPLAGIKKDLWAALALADYIYEAGKLGKVEEW